MKSNLLRWSGFITISGLLLVSPAYAQTTSSSLPVFQGPAWGTPLDDFKASKGSKLTYSTERMEARALDFILTDFHPVDKDDPDRAPKFAPQTTAGDSILYIFYDGKLCAASVALALPDVMDKFHQLNSQYKKAGYYTQRASTGFYGYHGSQTVFFHHFLYVQDSSTTIDFVKVTGYYDDAMYYGKSGFDAVQTEEGELMAGYLVYVSADYLKGPNAYTDWLENRKNASPPQVDPIQRFKCSIEH